jgi:large subunit ribosomal protein L18
MKTDRKQRTRTVHSRIRRKLAGTTGRPRLAVHRSLNHIYAQVIDDTKGVTLAQASTVDKDVRGNGATGNVAAAKTVGELIASRLKAIGVSEVVFDRGGFLYHGRVKALAEAARAAGLKF